MPGPAVSVVMSAYNTERYIESAINSILAQTFTDFELIVVDDGSTDGTLGAIKRVAEQDERVRVFQQKNAGICVASNFAIAQSRAPLIARLDSDDLAQPDRLAKQVAFMRANQDVVCLGTYVDYIDEKNRLLTTIQTPLTHEAIEAKHLEGHCSVWHTSAMFTRAAFDKVDGYNTDYACCVDMELWLRLGEVGRLANLPERLQQYRMHLGSVSAKKRDLQRELARRACEQAAERRGIACRFNAEEDWRPGEDRASRFTFAKRFGWWAYNSGERSTAAVYGLKTIGLVPWKSDGWRLLASALFKPAKPVTMARGGAG